MHRSSHVAHKSKLQPWSFVPCMLNPWRYCSIGLLITPVSQKWPPCTVGSSKTQGPCKASLRLISGYFEFHPFWSRLTVSAQKVAIMTSSGAEQDARVTVDRDIFCHLRNILWIFRFLREESSASVLSIFNYTINFVWEKKKDLSMNKFSTLEQPSLVNRYSPV